MHGTNSPTDHLGSSVLLHPDDSNGISDAANYQGGDGDLSNSASFAVARREHRTSGLARMESIEDLVRPYQIVYNEMYDIRKLEKELKTILKQKHRQLKKDYGQKR